MIATPQTPPVETDATRAAAQALAEMFAQERSGEYEVTVGTRGRFGDGDLYYGNDSKEPPKETVEINLRSPAIVEAGNAFEKTVEAVLKKLPVGDYVQVESDEDHVKLMREKIEAFTQQGAAFNPALLAEWKGFDPERRDHEVEDHALQNLHRDDMGASFSIHFRKKSEEVNAEVSESTELAKAFNENPDMIKEVLAYQVKKYAKDLSEEEIKAQIDQLTITAEAHNYDNSEGVYVNIRSPKQVEAAKEPRETQRSPEKMEELREDNLLTRQNAGEHNLTDAEFGKTLGRAFLYEMQENAKGERRPTKTNDVFFKIAGRKDAQKEIARTLHRFAKDNPEAKESVEAFLDDDMFKNHDRWGGMVGEKKEPMKGKIAITPNASGDVSITFGVPEGKAYEVVQQIAEAAKECTCKIKDEAPALPEVGAAEPPAPVAPVAEPTPQHCDIAQQHSQAEEDVRKMGQIVEAARAAAAQVGVNVPRTWTERKEQERLSQQNSTGLSA